MMRAIDKEQVRVLFCAMKTQTLIAMAFWLSCAAGVIHGQNAPQTTQQPKLDLDKFMSADGQKFLGFDKLNASQRDYLESWIFWLVQEALKPAPAQAPAVAQKAAQAPVAGQKAAPVNLTISGWNGLIITLSDGSQWKYADDGSTVKWNDRDAKGRNDGFPTSWQSNDYVKISKGSSGGKVMIRNLSRDSTVWVVPFP